MDESGGSKLLSRSSTAGRTKTRHGIRRWLSCACSPALRLPGTYGRSDLRCGIRRHHWDGPNVGGVHRNAIVHVRMRFGGNSWSSPCGGGPRPVSARSVEASRSGVCGAGRCGERSANLGCLQRWRQLGADQPGVQQSAERQVELRAWTRSTRRVGRHAVRCTNDQDNQRQGSERSHFYIQLSQGRRSRHWVSPFHAMRPAIRLAHPPTPIGTANVGMPTRVVRHN